MTRPLKPDVALSETPLPPCRTTALMSVQVTVRGVGSMVMRNTSQCDNRFHPGYCPSEPHCVFNQQVQILNIKDDHYDRFHPYRPPPAQSQHWLTAEVVWTWPHQRTLRTSGRDVKVHKQDRDVSSRARCALSPHHPHFFMFRGVMMNEGLTGPPVAGDGK